MAISSLCLECVPCLWRVLCVVWVVFPIRHKTYVVLSEIIMWHLQPSQPHHSAHGRYNLCPMTCDLPRDFKRPKAEGNLYTNYTLSDITSIFYGHGWQDYFTHTLWNIQIISHTPVFHWKYKICNIMSQIWFWNAQHPGVGMLQVHLWLQDTSSADSVSWLHLVMH